MRKCCCKYCYNNYYGMNYSNNCGLNFENCGMNYGNYGNGFYNT